MKYDVIVIGGGAAGLSAALSASRKGARAAVLEAAPRVGRKILASGNGRCNLANSGPPVYPGGGDLARQVLENCPVSRVLSFFAEGGLVTHEEAGGRLYPACGQAAAVLDVIRNALERQGVPVFCDCPAQRIERTKDGFAVHTPQGRMEARAAVAACGGMAGGRLGHDGKAYGLLTDLGHTLIPPTPALTPLETEKAAVKGLSGLRCPVILTLCRGDEPVEAARGEALFTDYGISGVCAMQLSRRAGQMLREEEKPLLYVDFSPMLGVSPRLYERAEPKDPFRHRARVLALLTQRKHILGEKDVLLGLLPRLLREKLRGQGLEQLAQSLCAYPLPVTGVRGMDQAQVTRGGIPGREVRGETLESRLVPGLFIAGEMLDVDGGCGGFNLQFAFASGILAGENAARRG